MSGGGLLTILYVRATEFEFRQLEDGRVFQSMKTTYGRGESRRQKQRQLHSAARSSHNRFFIQERLLTFAGGWGCGLLSFTDFQSGWKYRYATNRIESRDILAWSERQEFSVAS